MDNTIKIAAALVAALLIGILIGTGLGAGKTVLENNTKAYDLKCPICRACPPEKICTNECKRCPTCPPQKQCSIQATCPTLPTCPKPPRFDKELSRELEHWFKNGCRMKEGSSGYQSGSADTCDQGAEYFEVPGYPRFKTRPGQSVDLGKFYGQGKTTEKNPGYFTFPHFEQYGNQCFKINQYPDEKDRPRWSWNKDECAKSTMTICQI